MIIVYTKKLNYKKMTTYTSLFLLLLILGFTAFPKVVSVFNSSVATDRKIPIYSVDTTEKKVAITFDSGWSNDNTLKILEILEKHNVKATFFPVGSWVNSNADKLKLINEKGHEVGNHSNTHPTMANISKEALIKEINDADEKIKAITGKETTIFRAPSGEYNNLVLETVESLKKYTIQWDVDSIDWKNEGADIEYNRVMNKVKPGSIILFHNEAKYTPDNLDKIISKLKSDGYTFSTISDLIYKENYEINGEGKQIYLKKH